MIVICFVFILGIVISMLMELFIILMFTLYKFKKLKLEYDALKRENQMLIKSICNQRNNYN